LKDLGKNSALIFGLLTIFSFDLAEGLGGVQAERKLFMLHLHERM